jgi:hypothetical protein
LDVTNTISGDQFSDIGVVWLRSLNALLHANSAAGSVTISVFAWMTNVEMAGLTSFDSNGLSPQMGKEEIDEANTKGIISEPATAVARAAAALKNMPYVGPYARATEGAANIIGSVASSMGYCRPPVTKAPEPMRPTAVSALANTNVPDVTNKLTVDHKQINY